MHQQRSDEIGQLSAARLKPRGDFTFGALADASSDETMLRLTALLGSIGLGIWMALERGQSTRVFART